MKTLVFTFVLALCGSWNLAHAQSSQTLGVLPSLVPSTGSFRLGNVQTPSTGVVMGTNIQLGRPNIQPRYQSQQGIYYPPQTVPQTPYWALPQHPSIVTPNQVQGYDQFGNLHTQNTQVENTFFDPNRNRMQYNGTRRFVRRPVYGVGGRIVGYEQGHVWNNTITGAEHHDLNVITQTPQGVHKQRRLGF